MLKVLRDRARIIIDLSEGDYIQVGLAGEAKPRAVFPSIVGRAAAPSRVKGKRGVKRGRAPRPMIDHGIVTSWDDLERVVHDACAALRVAPEEHSMLFVESPVSPKANREGLTKLAFEKFNAPAFTVVNAALACLRANGRATGIAVIATERDLVAAPVIRGVPNYSAVRRVTFGGRDLTEYLQREVEKRSPALKKIGAAEQGVVRDIKEKLSYVALDYDEELEKAAGSSAIERRYKLPGGQMITIGAERFRAPEALFKPSFIGLEQDGIHKLTFQSIMKCDVDVRKDLYGNVVMSGGTTMFNGIPERLQKELKALAPDSMTIKIIAPPEREHSVWIGGSILSSLSTFEEMWISKNEYDEAGPSIVHRKCN